MSESRFQSQLIKELKVIFDGCIVLKNDASYMQGVPDILILYKNKWAMLEVKASLNSPVRPNQEYYVDILDDMSFARFICPENKEEVLNDLQHTFRVRR
jgi:hypothetical protein